MQNWRAIAHLANNKDALITLGHSQYHITNIYQEAFLEVIHIDLQATCEGITMQKWHGSPVRGHWIDVADLRIPGCK